MEGKSQLRYTVTHCMHCSQPLCQEACPVNAISRRQDGVILINEELCIGCKDCLDACPLGVMQFEEEKKVARKCNLCIERIDMGLAPACVNVCPSHCIYFGDIGKIAEKIGKQRLLAWYKGVGVSE
jgi:Fe-S-cluster-containing dehydrogenase component